MKIAGTAEIERVLSAIGNQGLTIREASFDENGNPVVKCLEGGELRKQAFDELLRWNYHSG